MTLHQSTERILIEQAAAGDSSAVSKLFVIHHDRLSRMINARLDPRLLPRLDPSDVIQEVNVEVARRLPEYLEKQEIPFFNWLRFLTRQKLAELVRRNIFTQARDVRREVPIHRNVAESSFALSGYLQEHITSPSSQLQKDELHQLLLETIELLPEMDREILQLRHVEHLSSAETAVELGITENTCRQRHIRALKRLKELLSQNGIRWGSEQ